MLARKSEKTAELVISSRNMGCRISSMKALLAIAINRCISFVNASTIGIQGAAANGYSGSTLLSVAIIAGWRPKSKSAGVGCHASSSDTAAERPSSGRDRLLAADQHHKFSFQRAL